LSRSSRPAEVQVGNSDLDLTHLRRNTRTALELAVAALAPSAMLDDLAVVSGLLEALEELPRTSPPVLALVPNLVKRGTKALERWNEWHAKHLAGLKA
jgi:hypothetical protein